MSKEEVADGAGRTHGPGFGWTSDRWIRPAIPVPVKRLPHFEGLELPAYATEGAAGMDVLAAEDVTLAPGARHAVATGLAVAIPHGFRDPGAAALGPCAQAWGDRAQHARHYRFGLSRRIEGHHDQPRRHRLRDPARRPHCADSCSPRSRMRPGSRLTSSTRPSAARAASARPAEWCRWAISRGQAATGGRNRLA